MCLELFDQGAHAEAEHSGVPQVVASGEVLLGSFQIRFLDKAADLEAPCERRVLIRLDIAKAGFRVLGTNTEGDQPAFGCQLPSLDHCIGKGALVFDQMIGRQYQHLGIGTIHLLQLQGCHRHSSSRVATEGFENEALRDPAAAGQAILVFGLEEQFAIGNGHNLGHILKGRGTTEGLLNQVLAIG
ncbi:hypothetical protein D3C78_1089330 [compost metagenome]